MFVEFQREMQETRLDAAMEQQATNRATTTVAWRDARTRQAIDEPSHPAWLARWRWRLAGRLDTDCSGKTPTTGAGALGREAHHNPPMNSMATVNSTTMLEESITFFFGSWICVADGHSGFSSHLANSRVGGVGSRYRCQ